VHDVGAEGRLAPDLNGARVWQERGDNVSVPLLCSAVQRQLAAFRADVRRCARSKQHLDSVCSPGHGGHEQRREPTLVTEVQLQ
jgi:hypothetical protein